MSSAPPSFLQYIPHALAFGTSGLRGLVRELTDLEVYINTRGTLNFLLKIGDIFRGDGVALAGDLRPSTDRILLACTQAIVDLGLVVEYVGKIPTPALIAHCLASRRAGVMVTGSHIPFDRNGIKINKSVGEILKAEEPAILFEVDEVRSQEYAKNADESAFDAWGMFRKSPPFPAVSLVAAQAYFDRFVSAFQTAETGSPLQGLRVMVYQHSAVGRDLLAQILQALGADVVCMGRSETFVPIDTENITADQLTTLEQLLVEAEHSGHVDVVVSTDGDSDRPLMLAVLPAAIGKPRLQFLPGDLLGIVVAEFLNADAAVVPISANDAVALRLAERKTLLRQCKIGSPYVVAALAEIAQTDHFQRIVGWEANGGFLTQSTLQLGAGLPALPTRDAILPILCNLIAAAKDHISVQELWHRLPARFGGAGLLDEVPSMLSQRMLAAILPDDGENLVEVRFGDGVVFGRSDNGEERLMDVQRTKSWETKRIQLEQVFSQAANSLIAINMLDGVRLSFSSGDVAHVRPSGNAPQLRIYSNSDTQRRADELVALAVAEPDGFLRRLTRSFPTSSG